MVRLCPWLLVALLAHAACAPVYERRYELTPPADQPAARACLGRCATEREACTAAAGAAFQRCDLRAQQRYELCQRNASIEVDVCKRSRNVDCTRRICTRERCSRAGLETCEADYRACFAACGGSVSESSVCVANCP